MTLVEHQLPNQDKALVTWKEKKVANNMLNFYKKVKGNFEFFKVSSIFTSNPKIDEYGIIQIAITLNIKIADIQLRLLDLENLIDLKGKEYGVKNEGEWELSEPNVNLPIEHYSKKYLFPVNITKNDRVAFKFISGNHTKKIYRSIVNLIG